MPRALPIHLPTKRIALGKSLGPMTTRATTTTSNNSVGATSNIQLASPQEEGSELVVLVGRRRHRRDVGSALAFDMLRCGGGRNVIFRHALFEALYTLGDVAHHVRKAAFADQQQDQNPDDQHVPEPQTTHLTNSLRRPYKNITARMHHT